MPRTPTLVLFGDHDWMNFKGSEEAVKELSDRGAHVALRVVPSAGVYNIMNDDERSI